MKTKKYHTYAQLAAAFKSGELTKHHYLMLDKGGTENMLCFHNPKFTDEQNDAENSKCSDMFDGGDGIEGMLTALGIKNEWC